MEMIRLGIVLALEEDDAWLKEAFPWSFYDYSFRESMTIWEGEYHTSAPDRIGYYSFIKGDKVIMLWVTVGCVKIVYRSKGLYEIFRFEINEIVNLDNE